MIADRPTVEQELAAALLPSSAPEDHPEAHLEVLLADDQDPTILTDAGLLRLAHLRALERAYICAEAARLAWAARLDAGLAGPDALAHAPFHLRHEGGADYLEDAGQRLFGASWRGAERLDRIAARLVLWRAERRAGRRYMERPSPSTGDPDAAVLLTAARDALGPGIRRAPVTVRLTRIRCEACGNTDPAHFTRTYLERHAQKLACGIWTTLMTEEAYDGQDTLLACDLCGSAATEDAHEELPDNVVGDPTAGVTEALSNLITGVAEPGSAPLTLLEDDPARGYVALSTPNPANPTGPCRTLKLHVVLEP